MRDRCVETCWFTRCPVVTAHLSDDYKTTPVYNETSVLDKAVFTESIKDECARGDVRDVWFQPGVAGDTVDSRG